MKTAQQLEQQRIPEFRFKFRSRGDWQSVTTSELFAGKKVILFALPGAFTPTCSSTHVPRYNELAEHFKQNGIDRVICLSVNDAFVMEAWQQEQRAENLFFLPDGTGEFSDKLGMLVDKSDIGFGKRSWRYALLINDGVIEKAFIEPNKPGDPFEVSDADTMAKHLGISEKLPAEVTIFTKPGCPFCLEAKALLTAKGYHFEEIVLGQNSLSFKTLRTVTGEKTVPQIYIDKKHIKGLDGLKELFKASVSKL